MSDGLRERHGRAHEVDGVFGVEPPSYVSWPVAQARLETLLGTTTSLDVGVVGAEEADVWAGGPGIPM